MRKDLIKLLWMSMVVAGCQPKSLTLDLSNVKNFDSNVSEHILFLNYEVRASDSRKKETVILKDATSGNGKLKDLSRPVVYPYRMEAELNYGAAVARKEMLFEHPLYRQVEVASQDGTLSSREMAEKIGNLLIRIQENKNLEKLTLYSITPDRGKVVVHTIDFKR